MRVRLVFRRLQGSVEQHQHQPLRAAPRLQARQQRVRLGQRMSMQGGERAAPDMPPLQRAAHCAMHLGVAIDDEDAPALRLAGFARCERGADLRRRPADRRLMSHAATPVCTASAAQKHTRLRPLRLAA